MVNRNTYVSMLTDEMQQDIRKELFDFYFISHDEMNIREVSDHIMNGMGSRLNDLQGLIDISPYIEEDQTAKFKK